MAKTLQELTIKDNFMFGVVMSEESNCKPLLEMILGITIDRIEIRKEDSISYLPEARGVRLDVHAKDEYNTHYNIEMQACRESDLLKRIRYYHSQIDMDLIATGTRYKALPNVYVIFICDYDPFGSSKYVYSFENHCIEDNEIKNSDGIKSIVLSTRGTNKSEVSEDIIKFLDFVHASLEESKKDFDNLYVKQLQNSVSRVKLDRKLGVTYMTYQELIDQEKEIARNEGLTEGRTEGRTEQFRDVVRTMSKSLTPERIAEILEKDIDEIKEFLV